MTSFQQITVGRCEDVSGEIFFASSKASENDTLDYDEPISPPPAKSNIGQAAAAPEHAQPASTVAPNADTPGVIESPPRIFLGALGVGFGLNALIGGPSRPSTVARPVGAALIVAGAALMGAFVRAFGRAGTPCDPGTPSETVVTDGPYQLTRNPGYLGMALMYSGIAIISNAPWALVPLPVAIAVIDRGVIAREERYLERKFGAPYTDYKRRVRRWV